MPFILRLIALVGGIFFLASCDTVAPPNPPPKLIDRFPSWSPDGHKIAYVHVNYDDVGYETGLYVLDLETGARRLVLEGFVGSPDWSPDGRSIAFSRVDIYTVEVNGGERRRLTGHGSAYFPSWSPNGSRIAYDATMNQPKVPLDSSGIWIISPDGKERKHLGLGRHADWSVNGEKIVYAGPPSESVEGAQIWIADTLGRSRVHLTANTFIDNRYPTWSPDGHWIAWTALPADKLPSIWMMRADGSEEHELVEGARYPSWSPDSEYLVFSKRAPGSEKYVLWTVRRDGTELKRLTFLSP